MFCLTQNWCPDQCRDFFFLVSQAIPSGVSRWIHSSPLRYPKLKSLRNVGEGLSLFICCQSQISWSRFGPVLLWKQTFGLFFQAHSFAEVAHTTSVETCPRKYWWHFYHEKNIWPLDATVAQPEVGNPRSPVAMQYWRIKKPCCCYWLWTYVFKLFLLMNMSCLQELHLIAKSS